MLDERWVKVFQKNDTGEISFFSASTIAGQGIWSRSEDVDLNLG